MEKTTITQIHEVNLEELIQKIIETFRKELINLNESNQPAQTQETVYLTRTEAAKFLKVSKVTLNNWAKKGIIHPKKIGNLVRYDLSELEKALR